jgi:hypothetical protein
MNGKTRTLLDTAGYAHLHDMRDTRYVYPPRSDIAREQHRTLRARKARRGARTCGLRQSRVDRKQRHAQRRIELSKLRTPNMSIMHQTPRKPDAPFAP